MRVAAGGVLLVLAVTLSKGVFGEPQLGSWLQRVIVNPISSAIGISDTTPQRNSYWQQPITVSKDPHERNTWVDQRNSYWQQQEPITISNDVPPPQRYSWSKPLDQRNSFWQQDPVINPITVSNNDEWHSLNRYTKMTPNEPCSNVFSYESSPSGEVVGLVSIVPPIDRSSSKQTVNLEVTLVVGAKLPSSYVGQITLRDSKDSVIAKLSTGNNAPIYYRVQFPLQNPRPRVQSVKANDLTLCYDSPDVGPSRTTLTLRHSLFAYLTFGTRPQQPPSFQTERPYQPPIQTERPYQPPLIQTERPYQPQIQLVPYQPPLVQTEKPYQPPVQTERPYHPPVVQTLPPYVPPRPTQAPQNQDAFECGTSLVQSVKPLVVQGEAVTKSGEWPWIVAMFHNSRTGFEFKCGGTLVSQKHVVTAAHCVQFPSQSVIHEEKITIFAGKHNIRNLADISDQAKKVRKIIVHPNYLDSGHEKLDNDLAILVLRTEVTFSSFVKPICLWEPYASPDQLLAPGTVVGWGKDGKGDYFTDEPNKVDMPIVTQEECLRSHQEFVFLTSNSTLCAGSRNGAGPCTGDSGGGLFVADTSHVGARKRWMLRGVVSHALLKSNTCDLSNYVVFTDVAKMMPWITATINQNS